MSAGNKKLGDDTRKRLSAAGLRAFFRIADVWSLNVAERRAALGYIAQRTLYKWRDDPEGARLNGDQLDRISYVVGIYKALHILFARSKRADSWIRRPNEALPFGGKPAAAILFSGRMEDMIRVRRYLDAQLECSPI
jgi:uncharacterized protein (DUF2384 family)